MHAMKRYLKLLAAYFQVNLGAALEYRSSFFVQAFGMALSNASFVFFWWIAFQQIGGRIGGYDFQDVLFIWAVCSSAFGLSNIVFGNMNQITRLIVNGELDTYLLQPKNVLFNLLPARTSLSAWGDLAYGLILLIISQGDDASVWLPYGSGVILGALLMTAIAVTAHSCTFFLGDASMIGNLAVEFVVNFCIYPIGIYPQLVRFLMYSLVPAAFIVHIPLRLARDFSWQWLGIEVIGTLLYCCFAVWFFHKGLKRYESGNLIVTRM